MPHRTSDYSTIGLKMSLYKNRQKVHVESTTTIISSWAEICKRHKKKENKRSEYIWSWKSQCENDECGKKQPISRRTCSNGMSGNYRTYCNTFKHTVNLLLRGRPIPMHGLMLIMADSCLVLHSPVRLYLLWLCILMFVPYTRLEMWVTSPYPNTDTEFN